MNPPHQPGLLGTLIKLLLIGGGLALLWLQTWPTSIRAASPAQQATTSYSELVHNQANKPPSITKETAEHEFGQSALANRRHTESLKAQKYLGFAELCCEQIEEMMPNGQLRHESHCDPLCVSEMRRAEERQRAAVGERVSQVFGLFTQLLTVGLLL